MSVLFEEVIRQARLLEPGERAKLLRDLIDDLDPESDKDVELAWLAESERRLREYKDGVLSAEDGVVVLERLRRRLQ